MEHENKYNPHLVTEPAVFSRCHTPFLLQKKFFLAVLGVFSSIIFSSSAHSEQMPSAIILGLSNSGIQIQPLQQSNVYFDLANNNYAVHTSWVGPQTGFLVNGDNVSSIKDMFRPLPDMQTALRSLDVDMNGVINARDPGFSTLRIWVDANGNGKVDLGEIHTLTDAGITTIRLSDKKSGTPLAFVRSDGSVGQIAELVFDSNPMDSRFRGRFRINPSAMSLPDMRGYGTLPDLYVAMSMDSSLLAMVQTLAGGSIRNAASFDLQVTDIIYRWAGVDGVDPTSRGGYVNAQDLGAMEAVLGKKWRRDGSSNPPSSAVGGELEKTWNILFTAVKERLLAQGPLSSLVRNVGYNYDKDSLTGTADFSALATAVAENVPSDPETAVQYLASMGQFMDQLASDLRGSASDYDGALASDFTAAGLPLTAGSVDTLHYLAPTYDGSRKVTFTPDSHGAIANGVAGFTNVFVAHSDMSQYVLNDIQTLDTSMMRKNERLKRIARWEAGLTGLALLVGCFIGWRMLGAGVSRKV